MRTPRNFEIRAARPLLFVAFALLALLAPLSADAAKPLRLRVTDAATGKPVVGAKGGIVGTAQRLQRGDKGELVLRVLPAMPFEVWAVAPGFLESTLTVGLVGVAPLETRLAIDEVGAEPLEFPLERALEVRGVVVDASGEPVQGATVFIRNLRQRNWSEDTLTDEKGHFLLVKVVRGTNELSVTTPDGRHQQRIDVPLASPIRIAVAPTVFAIAVTGPDGEPVANARVFLRSEALRAGAEGSTDARGEAVGRGLAPGDWQVQVRAPGFAPSAPLMVAVEAGKRVTATVTLAKDGRIRGRVVDASGNPIARASVRGEVVTRPGAPSWPSLEDVRTDAEGRFVLENVAPAPHSLWAMHPDYECEARVRAEPGDDEVRIPMAPLTYVRGRVLLNGVPVKRFSVNGFKFESADGRFEFRRFGSGERLFTLTGPFAPHVEVFNIAPGEVRDLGDMKVSPAATLEATFIRNGRPAASYRVSLEPEGCATNGSERAAVRANLRTTATDADGRVRFEGLAPGRYLLLGTVEAGVMPRWRQALKAGETSKQTLALEPGARLAGVVRDGEGRPVAGAVVVASEDGKVLGMELTGPQGKYLLAGLPAGSFSVIAVDKAVIDSLKDCDPWTERGETVAVEAGGTTQRDLRYNALKPEKTAPK